MEQRNMALETTGFFGAAAVKAIGVKVALGMAGAALLYMLMPPERLDGSFNKKEFAARLAVAGLASLLLGDWVVDVVDGLAPWLKAAAHPKPFFVAAGAPGWWVSRAVALWIYRRQNKDIAELAREIKNEVHP